MANTKSAQKAFRNSEKKRVVNTARRSALKTSIKKLLVALNQPELGVDTEAMLRTVAAQLARAKSKHLIHRNAASRTLGRLARRVSAQQRSA